MLVAAAKINQSSIVPAFDQTRVPRIIQVPSGAVQKVTLLSSLIETTSYMSMYWYPASLITITTLGCSALAEASVRIPAPT